jgi:transcriptional regulator with XRE-family HTH domain
VNNPLDQEVWERRAREFGVKLYVARAAAGLSQEQAAHGAGISVYTYQKLEHGQSNPGTPANPRLRTLYGLAEVLNVAVAELLPEADQPRSYGSRDGDAEAQTRSF